MADPIVNVTTRVFSIEVTKKENKVEISAPGPQGAVGVGFPIGGTTGQFLTKIDGTNYNTQWITLPNYLTVTSAAATYQPIGNYLTSYTETDPIFVASPAYTITSQQISNWNNPTVFPSQSGNNGKFLTTNGSTTSWATVDALPSQSGNNGKYLQTNGSSASWQTLDLSLYLTTADASTIYLTKTSASSLYQPIGSYLTSYTETDTLSSVTGRGASTSSVISITNTTQSTSYSTGSLIVGGGVGIAKDLYVQGDIKLTGSIDINGTITGNLTQVNVTDLNVTDSLIYLGSGNLTSDTLDIGFNGAYRPTGDISGHKHTGFVRDHNDSGIWKLFSGAAEITGNDVDFGLNDVNVNFDQLKIKSLIVTDAPTTRTNLGLGTMAVETASNYLTVLSASSTYQPKDQNLIDISALTGDGIIRKTAGVWGMDSNTYALSSSLSSYAPLSNPVFLTGIYFEGSTADANKTLLTVVNPTGSRTITLPDASGTVPLLETPNAFTVGGHTITSSANVVPLAITGGASPTVDYFSITDSTSITGGSIFKFNSDGRATFTKRVQISTSGDVSFPGILNVFDISGGGTPLIIARANAAQYSDLFQSRVGTTVLGGITPFGTYYTGSTTPIVAGSLGSNLTIVGSTVSVNSGITSVVYNTSPTAPNLQVGQQVIISGSGGTPLTTNGGTTTVPVTITAVGATSFTAVASTASTSGSPYTGTATVQVVPMVAINVPNANTAGLVIKNPSISPVGNLQEWTYGTNAINSFVTPYGQFAIRTGGVNYGAGLNVSSSNPYNTSIISRSTQGQSNDNITIQNSSGTAIAGISASGQIYSGTTAPFTSSFLSSPIVAIPISATSQNTGSQTVTYTTVSNHGLVQGQNITISGNTTQTTHNIAGIVNSVISNTQFTMLATAAAGSTLTSASPNAGTVVSNNHQVSIQSNNIYSSPLKLRAAASKSWGVTAASGASGTVTYTTATQSGANALVPGDNVVVTGVTGFNLSGQVVTSSATSFTISNAATGSISGVVGGTVTVVAYASTLQLESGAGSVVMRVDSDGSTRAVAFANLTSYSNAFLTPLTTGWVLGASASASTSIPLKIQNANAGNITGDLTQWLSNTGSVLTYINSAGVVNAPGISISGNSVFNYTATFQNNTVIPLIAKNLGGSADIQQWQNSGGTALAKVDYLGNMTAVSITLSSDERLKKNITPISGALDKINRLNGYTFNRLEGEQREVGVIAQEVLEVMPELVKESDGYYSVAYPNMVALLIESIKELKREIEELKSK